MFSRIHIIAVFACVGIGVGIAPQFSLANSPNLGRDLLSIFRPNHSPVATNEVPSNTAAAMSHHRLARTFAAQNDVNRANANFSLALQNAAPRQVAAIATDYAAFLIGIGDLHRAELMLRQALSQSPNDTEVIRMLARCLVKQNKMAEGLRHFRSIGTEAEARAEIAAIYREQGNTEMLVAVEQRWGSTSPEAARPAPVLVAATSRPPTAAASPEAATSEPTRVAASPRPVTAPPLPGAVQTVAAPREVATVVVASVAPSLPRSESFNNRVPRSAPLPVARARAAAPTPAVPEVETKEPPRSTVAILPRRHYVVEAGTFADLEALLPTVQPVVTTVSAQSTR